MSLARLLLPHTLPQDLCRLSAHGPRRAPVSAGFIIRWVQEGSSRDAWDSEVQAIVQANCLQCHGVIPGLPNLGEYDEIKNYAAIDEGATVSSLTRVSHIHLFGIAFIFFFVCLIFSFSTGLSSKLKSGAIALPFAFLCIDILSWWLTKWYPGFAYLTILGGLSYNLAAAFMILTSLKQMWIPSALASETAIE